MINRASTQRRFKRSWILSLVGSAALVAAVTIGGAPANAAEVTPLGACDTSAISREVTSSSSAWVALSPEYHAINGTSVPNTVTFSASTGGSMSASYTGTIEGGVSAGIVTAKASVSTTISASVSYSTSFSTQYMVAAGHTGYAQVGTNAYTVRMNNVKYNGNCVKQVISSGTLTAPTSVGWKTWTS